MTVTEQLVVRPISGALGAEIHGFSLADMDDAGFQQLRSVLREHLVVFLPDQHLDPEEHLALGRRFGELERHPYARKLDDDHPEIVLLESEHGMIADVWHTDVTWNPAPPQFSIINALQVPAVGGDTMWSNQHLVFESLSAPMQELLLGLTALHTAAHLGQPGQKTEQPVVRRHPETGRPSLFVNRMFTDRIVQLSAGESDALLAYLYAFSEQPQFNCRYPWAGGTIGIWDNRATQHYVVHDFEARRVMTRVTILGDDPEPAGDSARWAAYAPTRFSAAAAPYVL